jgi:hypothetical protein
VDKDNTTHSTTHPSAFLIVSLEAARGTNVREPTSRRLALDKVGVEGVG